jgi:hypothetical protein
MRPGYIPRELTPLKGTSTLDHFAVFDIETSTWPDDVDLMSEEEVMAYHNKTIDPFLVCFYDGTKEAIYKGPDCLLEFLRNTLIKPYRGVPIFAHNGGKFDTVALFHLIRTTDEFKDFKIVPIFQNSRIMSMVVSKSDHAWSFRDSFSLMPHSLKKLAIAFNTGYEKAKMPSISYDEDPVAWDAYCMNDCKALYALLQKFNTTLQSIGGSVGYTTASTAMKTFRHTYLKNPIANSLEFNNLFRKAYYGGRTEIFNMYAREEDGPFYYYDVNSMYPAVMHDYDYPIDRPIRQTDVRLSALEGKTGIMECEIEAPALEYPLLPYHADTGKLLFPVGRWHGYYDLDFIRKAEELGYAITPIRCWTFLTGPIFKDFIDTMYLIKKTETGAMREIAKLMMNSLYGKFGERQDMEEIVLNPASIEGLYLIDNERGYYTVKKKHYAAHQIVQIATRVTSLAQLKLYSLIEMITSRGGRVYYCDTDSIICNRPLPTSDELGDIKLERGGVLRKGIYLLPKVYINVPYDRDESIKTRAMKGFSKDFQNKRSFEDYEEALLTGDFSKFNEYRVSVCTAKKAIIQHLGGFVTCVEEKQIRNCYDKRVVNDDFSTKPVFVG